MSYGNVTFKEIVVGATASVERALSQTEVEALLLVSGDVVPFHVETWQDFDPDELNVDAVSASAIRAIGSSVAGLITGNRRASPAGSTQRPSM